MTNRNKTKRLNDPLQSFRTVSVQSMHKNVIKQEEQAAAMVGGKRHSGSGSKIGHKSDASGEQWQVECKQTEKNSLVLKLEWLTKIQREAAAKNKWPMMHLRIESEADVPSDWIMIPKWLFEKANWEEEDFS
jgi:hypothetical protein